MENLMDELTEQDATEYKRLIREAIAAIQRNLDQMARDDEEIERSRERSAFFIADTRAVLERMERR